jgi:hypothetical protein
LRECTLRLSQPLGKVQWSSLDLGLCLDVQWRSGSPPLMLHDKRSLDDLGVVSYKAADDFVVTPAIGSMPAGLHPFLALWAVLLGLSSLSRYEPAAWSKMIDVDKSAEANAVENLLDEAISSVPEAALHLAGQLPVAATTWPCQEEVFCQRPPAGWVSERVRR